MVVVGYEPTFPPVMTVNPVFVIPAAARIAYLPEAPSFETGVPTSAPASSIAEDVTTTDPPMGTLTVYCATPRVLATGVRVCNTPVPDNATAAATPRPVVGVGMNGMILPFLKEQPLMLFLCQYFSSN
jgi:hypothetical protein